MDESNPFFAAKKAQQLQAKQAAGRSFQTRVQRHLRRGRRHPAQADGATPSREVVTAATDPEPSLDFMDQLTEPSEPTPEAITAAQAGLARLIERMEALVVGQRTLLERLVIALLAGGHVLIEGVPGLAKTRAVRALPRPCICLSDGFSSHPTCLPADLTGTQIYRPATGTFDVRPGPIVTSVLLADEINRAPAKVQSALLEAMQEGQITVGDETIALPETFWVLATQNPIEHEGTYPLPEAQLDRFLMKLVVGYPDRDCRAADARPAERFGYAAPRLGHPNERRAPAVSGRPRFWRSARSLLRSGSLRRLKSTSSTWSARLATRRHSGCRWRRCWSLAPAHGPRSRSCELHGPTPCSAGRDFVTPHDVKSLARDIMRHRILVSFEADAEGLGPDDIIQRILDHIPVP